MRITSLGAISLLCSMSAIAETTVFTDRDYMTSGFFQSNYVRGDNDGRQVNRVSTANAFGAFQENTYLEFDAFDWTSVTSAITSAVFRVEVVAGGFGADSVDGNPFDISLHSMAQDPWASIDPDATSGPTFYQDFVNAQFTTDSVVSTTTVEGIGVYEWDVTSLVQEWIANGDTNLAYTIGLSGILDTSGNDFLQGILNSTNPLLEGSETIGQIVFVPAPGSSIVLAVFGIAAYRRRRES